MKKIYVTTLFLSFLFTPIQAENALLIKEQNIKKEIHQTSEKKGKKLNVKKELKKKAYKSRIYVDEIPKEFEKNIFFLSPVNQQIIVKEKVLIKGKNEYLTDMMIDNEKVRLSGDGMFYYEKEIKGFGPQYINMLIFTENDQFFVLRKKILRLYSPKDIDQFKDKRKEYIYFFNSSFLYDNQREKQLETTVSRGDFAYFLARYKNLKRTKQTIPDVQNHWSEQAVNAVVNKKWMNLFPDGSFQPDKPITKIEYLMTITKVLKLRVDQSIKPMNIKDIPNGHWFIKYIRTGIKEGLITKSTHFGPKEPLSFAQLIEKVEKLPDYNQEIERDIQSLKEQQINQSDELLNEYFSLIKQREADIENNKSFVISYPKEDQFIFSDQVDVRGVILPVQEFEVNEIKVNPQKNGKFLQKVDVQIGPNLIVFNIKNKQVTRNVMRLESYVDLENHWLKSTAAKLKNMSLLDQTEMFEPNKQVDRKLFSKILVKLFDLKATDEPIYPEDINKQDLKKKTQLNHSLTK